MFADVVQRFLGDSVKTESRLARNIFQIRTRSERDRNSEVVLKLTAERAKARCQTRNLQHRRMQLMRKIANHISKLSRFAEQFVQLRYDILGKIRTRRNLSD